jgi:hypothetical protein
MRHEPNPRPAEFRWSSVAVMTLGMGVAVTISWMAFGRHDSFGLEPHDLLTQRRLWIYGSQFLLISAYLYALTRGSLRALSAVTLWASVTSAWLLEGVVLTVIGEPLVANELTPLVAWYFWLVATAGPLQPLAAFVGGWLGLRHAKAAQVASTGAPCP